MNTVRMILCGNVEDSRMNPSEKVGVVSVVFVSTEEEKIKNKLKKLQDKNPEKFYMEWDAISRYIYTGLQGGSIMKGWMKKENEMITCCSDGTRPVIFKIERIDYEEKE